MIVRPEFSHLLVSENEVLINNLERESLLCRLQGYLRLMGVRQFAFIHRQGLKNCARQGKHNNNMILLLSCVSWSQHQQTSVKQLLLFTGSHSSCSAVSLLNQPFHSPDLSSQDYLDHFWVTTIPQRPDDVEVIETMLATAWTDFLSIKHSQHQHFQPHNCKSSTQWNCMPRTYNHRWDLNHSKLPYCVTIMNHKMIVC